MLIAISIHILLSVLNLFIDISVLDCEDELVICRREDPESKDFEPEDRWAFTREPINKEERKKMLGKVIEEAIKVTFSNHIYMYSNKYQKKRKGGTIGLRLTGVIARIVMDT